MELMIGNEDWSMEKRASQSELHTVVLCIAQRNIDQIGRILSVVSDPVHPQYGHHLSFEEVVDMTSNFEATMYVEAVLVQHGIEVLKKSRHGEYITARASIAKWEHILNTKFYYYYSRPNYEVRKRKLLIRATTYSIPKEFHGKVSSSKYNSILNALCQI